MIKFFIVITLITFQFFGLAQPAFAGLPYGMRVAEGQPGYKRQVEYILDNSCNAIAMVPYSGTVYYSCASGSKYWSEVLVPTEKSPLFMYFKNRKKQRDEQNDYDTSNYSVKSN